MPYTVGLPGGINGYEYEVYVRLLEREGVDVANTSRVAEPASGKRWLHIWTTLDEAVRFAEMLKAETENHEWAVYEFSDTESTTGPLGPIVILVGRQSDGLSYSLSYSSQKLIHRRYPQVRIPPNLFISSLTQDDAERSQVPIWDQVAIILTGLPKSDIDQFGGFQVYDPERKAYLTTGPLVA